ncbi:MAG: YkoF family thiamine/hydroxymethylpyrimidine-binding protein [Woeseiaceae bacterium]|nr:YkoF family thiamine/hydroxymethylpyrimidine-binding protein [Woeseiaceae bacterium]
MRVAVDISLYPLADEYLEPIRDVIARLEAHAGVVVAKNPMSTQLRGDFDTVMDVLRRELRTTFEALPHAVFTIKILNNPHGD